ncbi:hypothetical protein IC580_08085 [Cupriavidus sp. ISTL7]|nr:hypothetical protein IC580_08085 [Cupriavidus sp. ISTL7]
MVHLPADVVQALPQLAPFVGRQLAAAALPLAGLALGALAVGAAPAFARRWPLAVLPGMARMPRIALRAPARMARVACSSAPSPGDCADALAACSSIDGSSSASRAPATRRRAPEARRGSDRVDFAFIDNGGLGLARSGYRWTTPRLPDRG